MNGAPQNPMSARSSSSSSARCGSPRARVVRLGHVQSLHVGEARDRLADDRPDTLDELDADAHPQHGRDDVGEEHGCVHAVPAHRLKRHLCAELRRAGDVEERVPLAQGAVFRQRASRLPHEPDRRALDRLAARDPHEERLFHRPRLAPCQVPGPLVVRWHAIEHAPVEAGAKQLATIEAVNAGTAPWRTRGEKDGIFVAYHWLDERGNPIVWDGLRTPLEHPVEPGATLRQAIALRGPIPARPLPALGRPRRGAPVLARRARQRPARARSGRPAARRVAGADVLPRRRRAGGGLARARARAPRGGVCRRRRRARARARPPAAQPGGARAVRAAAAAAIHASGIRSSARPSCRRSSRTPRWPASPPTAADGAEPWMFDGRLVLKARI